MELTAATILVALAANKVWSCDQSDYRQALGLTIPEPFLLRANEVIE